MNTGRTVLAPILAFAMAMGANAAAVDKQLTAAAADFAARQPPELQPLFRALYIEGEHNAVLNLDLLGLAALQSGKLEIAAKALDAAIFRIEAIYADSATARSARSVFNGEKVKDFKGEPYERAMTYFYRGLVYVQEGDFQNARASFLAAERQSMLSETEDYASTFGLMSYLGAWASSCDGDVAKTEELQARASTVQPDPFARLGPVNPALALIEIGIGPKKVGTGKYNEKLSFQASGRRPIVEGVALADGRLLTPLLGADLDWQAMTRGGRPIDAILKGKAQWKSATTTVADVATTTGYLATMQGVAAGNSDLANAGSITMVAGLFGSAIGGAMNAAADTRYWRTLPAGILILPLPAGADQTGASDGWKLRTNGVDEAPGVKGTFTSKQCSIQWARTHDAIEAANTLVASPRSNEKGRGAGNAQWRSFLGETFAATSTVPDSAATIPPLTGSGIAP